VAGLTQGLMWREYGANGYLVNSFADTVAAIRPMYLMRSFGGALYLAGACVMTFNFIQTLRGKLREEAPMTETPYDPAKDVPLTAVPAA